MGFRGSDILNLRFRDIDWKNREIFIVMKKTRTQITLPMTVDVGNAIYAYVRKYLKLYHPETLPDAQFMSCFFRILPKIPYDVDIALRMVSPKMIKCCFVKIQTFGFSRRSGYGLVTGHPYNKGIDKE